MTLHLLRYDHQPCGASRQRFWLLLPLAFVALLMPTLARAGDFMDSRITFVFSDDDLLHGAGETTPSSPRASFGVRQGRVFFFENHNRRDRGDETQSQLVTYKSMPGFIDGLTTEAALVMRLRVPPDGTPYFHDDGTYINLIYDLGDMDPRTGKGRDLTLTLFPFDTERFKLGYSYRMSWGGSAIFGKERKGPAPGIKLNWDHDGSYLFVGAKTAQIQRFAPEDQPRLNDEVDSFYAGLFGAGLSVDPFMFEVNGGYFQRGTNPRRGVRGEPVDAAGLSVQVSYHHGIPLHRSVDFSLYRRDPLQADSLTNQGGGQPQGAGPGVASPAEGANGGGQAMAVAPVQKSETSGGSGKGVRVSAEASILSHNLEDPESYGGIKRQTATAGDVNLVLGLGHGLQLFADVIYRDLAFVLFNQPSFVPFQDYTAGTDVKPEYWAGVGFDWALGKSRITPGLTLGVQRPASVTSVPEAGAHPPRSLAGRYTVVVRQEGMVSILPADMEATPIWAVKARVRWDLSPMVGVIGEVFGSIDNNRTELVDDASGVAVRRFEDPYMIGFGLVAQARF